MQAAAQCACARCDVVQRKWPQREALLFSPPLATTHRQQLVEKRSREERAVPLNPEKLPHEHVGGFKGFCQRAASTFYSLYFRSLFWCIDTGENIK